jgi:hypothetical protein
LESECCQGTNNLPPLTEDFQERRALLVTKLVFRPHDKNPEKYCLGLELYFIDLKIAGTRLSAWTYSYLAKASLQNLHKKALVKKE